MPIVDRLKHGVDLTKFKADQLMRINRVQGEIDGLRQQIAAIQRQLGVTAIEIHNRGELTNKELEDLCLQIDGLNQAIAGKDAMITTIRAEIPPQYVQPAAYAPGIPCQSCGFPVPPGADFCPNCGRPTPKPPPPSGQLCPSCGHSVPQGAIFCPDCGYKFMQTNIPTNTEESS
jgi:hypothetical protein